MSTCLPQRVGSSHLSRPPAPARTCLHPPLLSHLPSLSPTPVPLLSLSLPPPPPPPLSRLLSPCQLDWLWQDALRADQGTQLENWVSGAVWNPNEPSPAPLLLPAYLSLAGLGLGMSPPTPLLPLTPGLQAPLTSPNGSEPPPPLARPSPPLSSGCQQNSQLGGKITRLTVQTPHPGQSPSLGLGLPICKMGFHLGALLAQAVWPTDLSVFPLKQHAPYLLWWLASFFCFYYEWFGVGRRVPVPHRRSHSLCRWGCLTHLCSCLSPEQCPCSSWGPWAPRLRAGSHPGPVDT